MKRIFVAIGLAAGFLSGPLAQQGLAADDLDARDMWVAPNAGTLGAGIEAGIRWNENWGTRAGLNAGYLPFTYHDREADLVNRLSLLSAGVTADYHPFGGDFRLSGGARLSATRIEGRMRNLKKHIKGPGTDVTLTIKDPLTTFSIEQNTFQPYLGVGYAVQIKERMSLTLDFGMLYAGTPSLDVDSRAEKFGFTDKQIRREIERASNRIENFPVYPVVQVGFKLRF